MQRDELPQFTLSCGNVFADLDLPEPDVLLAKADLAVQIVDTLRTRGWNVKHAAAALGIPPEQVQLLHCDPLDSFSLADLSHLLSRLT